AFDDSGRLWVTCSVEYPFPVSDDAQPRDTVKILDQFGPNGRAGRVVPFADKLNIPIGLIPLPGPDTKAVVFSVPSVYSLKDTNGDNVADDRRRLYTRFGSFDTHGMANSFTWGFDGWVYANHGTFNESSVTGADGHAIEMTGGNSFRLRTDGSRIEKFAHGQANPFGMCIDSWGLVFTADCHSRPLYQLIRGATYPGSKVNDGLGNGPIMLRDFDGSTGIAGVVIYEADYFPQKHHGNAFVCDVVLNQVYEFQMEWNGSSPLATQQPFISCEDPWFRPVDIKLGPDGALYIADFYNRIISHYEVPLTHPGRDRQLGRIWRIVRKNQLPALPTPRLATATADQLVEKLADSNITVRMLAMNQLAKRGPNVNDALRSVLTSKQNKHQLVHSLWTLEQLGELKSNELIDSGNNSEDLVKAHAARILANRADLSGNEKRCAVELLANKNPMVQRAAAEVFVHHQSDPAINELFKLFDQTPKNDSHLRHVVRMAIRNQMRAKEKWSTTDGDGSTMFGIALGVQSTAACEYLLTSLENPDTPLAERGFSQLYNSIHHIARYGSADNTERLLQLCRKIADIHGGMGVGMFHAVNRAAEERGEELASEIEEWGRGFAEKLIDSEDSGIKKSGIDLVGILKHEPLVPEIAKIAFSDQANGDQRRSAISVVLQLSGESYLPQIVKLAENNETPIWLREHIIYAIPQADQNGRDALIQLMPTVQSRLQRAIVNSLVSSREGSLMLLAVIEQGKASPRLLQSTHVIMTMRFQDMPDAESRMAELTKGLPLESERISRLIAERRRGYREAEPTIAQGAAIFKKQCAVCHRLKNDGNRIGPELDGIGSRGLARLLEDVLNPNLNVDQKFRSTLVIKNDGRQISGLVLREEGETVILADSNGQEVRIRKSEIDEQHRSSLSPMPENLGESLKESDFYDLMAFLLDQNGQPGKSSSQPE
ncbi:MAG: c-type cytochrome, partial [Planctomycetota bacterium]